MTATSTAHDSPDATERNGVRAEESAAQGAETVDTSLSLFSMLRRLWAHLAPKRRWQLILLVAVMIASGLAEVVSLAAVVPLLSVLADPTRLWNQPWIRHRTAQFGMSQPQELILPVTVLFSVTAFVSAGIRLANLWLSGHVAATIGSDLSQEAYRRTLYQAYSVHMARNSSTVITGVVTHVSKLIHGVLYPAVQITANAFVIACLLIGILTIDPIVALSTMTVFATVYAAIAALTKSHVFRNSREQAEHNVALVKTVQEGLGSIRDVLLDRSQKYFVNRYQGHDIPLRRLWAQAEFLGGFPRFLIEGLGTVGIAFLACALVRRPGGITTALPLLGALALGAQRLLPAVQQSYFSYSQLRTNFADLASVIALLDQPAPSCHFPQRAPAPFQSSLALANVSYRYTPDSAWVLRNVNLSIAKGQRVALVGVTGCGKSTLADLLMGLLQPCEGSLLIDGRVVDPEAWQAHIAHVPQSIFLADTSIAENIAIGIPSGEIDPARLRFVAMESQIADFIESLPLGYYTQVGERGIRLSGGQRQRLGIARALYKQSSVLFFDEATSALDDATERAILETLARLSRDLTIVMIAHRISTTAYCERVIVVEHGGIRETSDRPATESPGTHSTNDPMTFLPA